MASITKLTLQNFFKHAKRYPGSICIIGTGLILTTTFDVYKPLLYRDLIDTLAAPGDNAWGLRVLVTKILLLGLCNQIVWRAMGFSNSNFQPRVMADLLQSSFGAILNHSMSFFADTHVGSIVNRIRRYPSSFESVDDQLKWNIGRTVLRCLCVFYVLWGSYRLFAYCLVVWVVVYVTAIILFTRYKMQFDFASATQDTKTTGFIADTVGNIAAVKSFAAEEAEQVAFTALTNKSFELRRYAWRLGQWAELFQGLSMVVLEAVFFYIAVARKDALGLTVGDFAFLQTCLVLVFDYLWDFGRYIRQMFESLANANELTEMLELPYSVTDVHGAHPLQVTAGGIEFHEVTFQYEPTATPTLSDFSLIVPPGRKVALVGESGAGKTTIAKLLLRFMNVTSGEIRIDGVSIAGVTQKSIRQAVAVVSQDPNLFHRSLAENIRYGRPGATDDEVEAAAKAAHCHEFISCLPEGYRTLVGERGIKLSGGQRQRIAIARAILKNSSIVFLDEATSALDSSSEALIQDALHELMQGRTLLVIAHRLSTIKEMDEIVVLHEGRIVERGTHEELIQLQGGHYRVLWEKQSGGFVAAKSSK